MKRIYCALAIVSLGAVMLLNGCATTPAYPYDEPRQKPRFTYEPVGQSEPILVEGEPWRYDNPPPIAALYAPPPRVSCCRYTSPPKYTAKDNRGYSADWPQAERVKRYDAHYGSRIRYPAGTGTYY